MTYCKRSSNYTMSLLLRSATTIGLCISLSGCPGFGHCIAEEAYELSAVEAVPGVKLAELSSLHELRLTALEGALVVDVSSCTRKSIPCMTVRLDKGRTLLIADNQFTLTPVASTQKPLTSVLGPARYSPRCVMFTDGEHRERESTFPAADCPAALLPESLMPSPQEVDAYPESKGHIIFPHPTDTYTVSDGAPLAGTTIYGVSSFASFYRRKAYSRPYLFDTPLNIGIGPDYLLKLPPMAVDGKEIRLPVIRLKRTSTKLCGM